MNENKLYSASEKRQLRFKNRLQSVNLSSEEMAAALQYVNLQKVRKRRANTLAQNSIDSISSARSEMIGCEINPILFEGKRTALMLYYY